MERKKATLKSLDKEFNLYRPHFQDVAKYLLPRKYIWIQALKQGQRANSCLLYTSPSPRDS